MRKTIGIFCLLFGVLAGTMGQAQSTAWVQIEAHSTLREAQDRARAYAGAFPQVNGFRMSTGWYAIALGPYTREDALAQMGELKRELLIPRDSFVAFSRDYGQQFWPVGANLRPVTPQVDPTPAVPQVAMPANPAPLPDETPAEARRSERDLPREARMRLQEALQWEGFYDAAIDGAFGPGTRRAMAAYQTAMGLEPTGILTTKQRAALLKGMDDALAQLGMRVVEDTTAGVSLSMPAAMVAFDRYEAPFAHYTAKDGSGVQVLLISQAGNQDTLYGLYDIMQTLEIVPVDGARERGRNSFELTGQSAALHSYTFARLDGDEIKGFTLAWPPGDEKLMQHAVKVMRDSFAPVAGVVLGDSVGHTTESQAVDLVSGLQVRRPTVTGSGFYVNGNGAVLTTTEVLGQCTRVTIADEYEAEVAARDDLLGLAVLTPKQPLAPPAYAAFRASVPRLNSDVAVAGFPYGGALDLPVLTFGQLADLRGLRGEDELQRLALAATPGDAGGPVFDTQGAVMGVLLAPDTGAQQLPGDVSFAAKVPAIADFLSAHGVTPAAAESAAALAPEDLTGLAADMTVLVSCWN
ncbi:trypsin-like peptidase domain-containing protein [Actibacterium ureilyticum]|uniref:trypsin-like peptidase domain-containing protein n=1 Tax=Actibacterium ureilyticum TaxID=1590614 RepID=UPI001FEC8808|nr:trypsin-like peptidase domain-containing protein [Actibacterium ureilyticum]